MSVRRVAQRYATALADLALGQGQQTVIQEELKSLSELMQSAPDLRQAFANPAVSKQQKQTLLEALIQRGKPTQLTESFLRVLLRNERVQHLDEMARAYHEELDKRLGMATAGVLSARPLTGEEATQLRAQLEKLSGKKVRLMSVVDPDIIGGVVAWIGSDVYDGSIHTQLERMGEELKG
jgi:F-type H+-transporting ATPase subunit delta